MLSVYCYLSYSDYSIDDDELCFKGWIRVINTFEESKYFKQLVTIEVKEK